MLRIDAQQLATFATQLLRAGGVESEEEAGTVADSLVGSNLRGHDSHGVMRIPFYLSAVEKGDVVPGAPFEVLRESDVVFAADGNWGFGQVQARRLTDRLIDMATRKGTATGTLIRSAHIGRLGEYCERAADAGLVSMVMVNTPGVARRVAPPGGRAPRLGTNPIAFGVPHADTPIILDIGTSATAEGKVRVKQIAGEPVPAGLLLDNQGRPTTNPNDLYSDPPGTILPMGGAQAYKGFGLGLIIEIFAGALSGGVCIRPKPINQNGNCVFMQLWDPKHLGGEEHFAAEVAGVCRFMRDCPRIEGVDEILLPGDPERRAWADRTRHGVPIDPGNWQQLTSLADKLGVVPPV